MNWGAVTLEVGLLALSIVVLGWDLIFASGGSHSGGFVSANQISSIWWGSPDGYSAARRVLARWARLL